MVCTRTETVLRGAKPMRVQVTIPIDIYKSLEKSCELKSPEDLMLKNGLIEEDRSAVKILCQAEGALSFLAWANRIVPGRSSLITINLDG